MIRTFAAAAVIAGSSLSFVAVAQAEDFPATPLSPGEIHLPGEGTIPGMRESLMVINGVTRPILQPVLAPGGDMAAASGPAPMMKHHRHHHMMMKHKTMKHKMMK